MKRILSTAIVLMISLSMLVGCTSPTTVSTTTGAATTTKAPASGATTTAPANAVLFAKKLEIAWFGGGNAPLEDNSWGEKKLEELFNIDIKVIRADKAETQALLFASGNIPDLIIPLNSSINSISALVGQGVLAEIPIDEIKKFMPTQYALGLSLDPLVFNYNIINGKNMAIPRFYYTASTRSPVIRADWLKAVGKKVPKTIDELEAVFIAFRNEDPDKDGKKNTYGMTGHVNDSEYTRMFATEFGAYGVNPFFWRAKTDGTVEMGFTTDDFVAGLKKLAKWYSLELIDPEFITNDYRTSGEDIAFKFANGKVGYMEGYSFDDYQVDNDGHVSAKWVAVNEEWKKYFADNASDAEKSYKFDVPTDFVDGMIEPYYIAMAPVTGPNGKSGSYKDEVIGSRICMGIQLEKQPEKRERLMRILEAMVANDDIGVFHKGPEEHNQWMWNADKTQRVYNPKADQDPTYHPQGIKDGTSWFFWPMWFNSAESIRIIGGAKNEQRYDRTFPIFKDLANIPDVVKGSLPSAAESPELMSTYIRDYIVQAIRGDVNIDATYPKMKADWFKLGGTQLTKEASEWYKSIK